MNQLIQCSVCYQFLPKDQIIIRRCGHRACQSCLIQHLDQLVLRNYRKLVCIDSQCNFQFEEQQAKSLIGRRYQKYNQAKKQIDALKKHKVLYCPNCFLNVLPNSADCQHCHLPFCRECGNKVHPDITCVQADQRQMGCSVKRCPSCNIKVFKQEGCNKTICQKCKCSFCWLCMQKNINYEHYNYGECKNKLFRLQLQIKERVVIYLLFIVLLPLIYSVALCVGVIVGVFTVPFFFVKEALYDSINNTYQKCLDFKRKYQVWRFVQYCAYLFAEIGLGGIATAVALGVYLAFLPVGALVLPVMLLVGRV